jgi:hypothetical protein
VIKDIGSILLKKMSNITSTPDVPSIFSSITFTSIDGLHYPNQCIFAKLTDINGNAVIDFNICPKFGTKINILGFSLENGLIVLSPLEINGNVRPFELKRRKSINKFLKIVLLLSPLFLLYGKIKKIFIKKKINPQLRRIIKIYNEIMANNDPVLNLLDNCTLNEVCSNLSIFGNVIIEGQTKLLFIAKVKDQTLMFFNV